MATMDHAHPVPPPAAAASPPRAQRRRRRRGLCRHDHEPEEVACGRCARRASLSALGAAVLLLWRPAACFVPPASRAPPPSMSLRKPPRERRKAPPADTAWSNAVRQRSELGESRFGMRRRARSVLEKAKKRTGIDNASVDANNSIKSKNEKGNGDEYFVQSGLNVIAETASIGGLDVAGAATGRGDVVSLDYVATGRAPLDKGSNETKSGDVGEEANGAPPKSGGIARPPSSSAQAALRRPEDDFVLRVTDDSKNNGTAPRPVAEREAFAGDVSAAFSLPREPLPFELPALDRDQTRRLVAGERVQYQNDMGRAGNGYVVWDVKAPAAVVWDCLLDFRNYPRTITTVREVVMYTNTHLAKDYRAERPVDFEDGTAAVCRPGVPSVTRAQFSLSKFRLKIAAVHKYRPHPKGDYMIFTLDPASRNPVLKYAKGIWYTQSDPDGKEGYTRVWLLCELRVSRLLPQWIVDYAAARAMPRATTWLKPMTEAAATLWLKEEA